MRSVEHAGCFWNALGSQDASLNRLGIGKLPDSFDVFVFGQPDFPQSPMSEEVARLARVPRTVMRVEAARQIVVTAITLQRYHLAHGSHPTDLHYLVPAFLSTLPLDPVEGQPLRYRSNADGTFLLYSVGENGVDDGGDPSLEKYFETSGYAWQNPHALDWVWPSPATDKTSSAPN